MCLCGFDTACTRLLRTLLQSSLTRTPPATPHPVQRVGPQKGAAAIAQAVRLLRRPGCALGRVLREELVAPPESAVNIFSRFRTAHPAEDCQVGGVCQSLDGRGVD